MPPISFRSVLPYHPSPTALFAQLCQNKAHTLLLESAEISSKNSLQSLLLIQAAIKITSENNRVNIEALTDNGKSLLPAIAAQLSPEHIASQTAQQLNLCFPPLDKHLDEDAKLHAPTIFDALRACLNSAPHSPEPLFLGGLFAYDLVRHFMPMDGITIRAAQRCPDYTFYLAEQLLTLDHQAQRAELISYSFAPEHHPHISAQAAEHIAALQTPPPPLNDTPSPSAHTPHTNHEDTDFTRIITQLKQHIHAGDIFQIVPSRRFSLPCTQPLHAYQRLKTRNPSPYMFYLQDADFTLFGASPESALKYTPETRSIEVYPIAGSRPRGFDQNGNIDTELDARLELELRLDQKELAEHLMLVDLARNDVARVCEAGSRRVAELMQVDRYSHIMHLVSRVVGTLRPELDALHAYQACMNMGTLTGAPKIKAMQLLYQTEGETRGSYGGAVGYLRSDGHFDTCIVIRSAFVQDGIAHVQAGCGTVLDSDPQLEADETRHKARAVLQSLQP